MRVEVDFEGGKNASGIYVHKKLPEAMGNSVAAFAHAVLSGQSQPGVWYPEEKEALAVSVRGVEMNMFDCSTGVHCLVKQCVCMGCRFRGVYAFPFVQHLWRALL
jgi:hypothetical protein